MKKYLVVGATILLMALVSVTAYAKPGKAVIKGELVETDLENGTVLVLSKSDEPLLIHIPADFDLSGLEVGDHIQVKGVLDDEGVMDADWAKTLKKDKEQDLEFVEEVEETQDDGDGGKETSAYCSGAQTKDHPKAAKLAEAYGVSYEMVMEYFCQGHGFGQIKLALQTSEVTGVDAAELLASREEGKGWGQIWKDLGHTGKPKADKEPPGQVKKGRVGGNRTKRDPDNTLEIHRLKGA